MREQHQQLKQAKEKARLANAREDEINNLHRTLADIQVTGDLHRTLADIQVTGDAGTRFSLRGMLGFSRGRVEFDKR